MDVEVARSLRDGSSLAVVVLDIDHFKRVNDEHGHEIGDRVLTWLGALLATEARGADVAARTGGEEFVAMLVGAGTAEAYAFAERVRLAVASCDSARDRARHGVPEGLELTVSAGVAAANALDGHALTELADQALYAAKRDGRNRTALADGSLSAA
jgi:diguanylate cyclase (GGDEF)-like protein